MGDASRRKKLGVPKVQKSKEQVEVQTLGTKPLFLSSDDGESFFTLAIVLFEKGELTAADYLRAPKGDLPFRDEVLKNPENFALQFDYYETAPPELAACIGNITRQDEFHRYCESDHGDRVLASPDLAQHEESVNGGHISAAGQRAQVHRPEGVSRRGCHVLRF